jgi:hypothetical protein
MCGLQISNANGFAILRGISRTASSVGIPLIVPAVSNSSTPLPHATLAREESLEGLVKCSEVPDLQQQQPPDAFFEELDG